ncbi:pyrroloquinoline quinone precursor peptide PqqA [Kitasatospora sp. RG8]|uniref:pyrroloquinoline quinone precursor peptide PqqA n=1 Tax=Kitasatospora sp. RG8 TaxID=2820815 RepID=UPI001ADF7120|nr:pyrroloquinoline quinone precursor peptide PqqA [Kitasatospora sp. RG8]MBP0449413.1 pyrroloquinoline quinone precursor peptide PqqA [Kitasatospora sp. RG8]
MKCTTTPRPAPAVPAERPAGAATAAKPAWTTPAVECHRTGAEVTAYAARTTR